MKRPDFLRHPDITIEPGKRHLKVKVRGRLVGVMPRTQTNEHGRGRSHKNLISQVNRALRERSKQ